MILHTICKKIKLETDTDKLINKIFRHVDLVNKMEGSRFSFDFTSKVTIKQVKVIAAEHSSYRKSLDWLRYKNAAINPKCFQYGFFLFPQPNNEIKNHPEKVSNIKLFIDMYITGRIKNIKQQ